MVKSNNLIIAGHFTTLRRNGMNQHYGIQSNSERLSQVEKNQEKIMESQRRIESLLNKISFHVVMETESIAHLFPINSLKTIEDFMSNSDGRFLKRKRELEKLIFSVWTPNVTKRQFSDNLINVLFTQSFIAGHRWPHIG